MTCRSERKYKQILAKHDDALRMGGSLVKLSGLVKSVIMVVTVCLRTIKVAIFVV